MSLIKCPECGLNVSDKSSTCVHCGYPLNDSQNTKCIINGIEYDLSFILDNNYSYLYKVRDFIQISHCDICDARKLIDRIISNKKIPKTLYIPKVQDSNVPKCPTCGSTNIQKISASAKISGAMMFGIFSKTAKSQWKCRNCGNKW